MNTIWFAHVGWAKPDEDRPAALSLTDLILEPCDSFESALWSLRRQADVFWGENGGIVANEPPNFDLMDEAQIRDAFAKWKDDSVFDPDHVLVEIKEVSIVRHHATGWQTLDSLARDLAEIDGIEQYHYEGGKSSGIPMVRCVVTIAGRQCFGPWATSEDDALKKARALAADVSFNPKKREKPTIPFR